MGSDAVGDGRYEGRTVFADNLNAPYGLALIGGPDGRYRYVGIGSNSNIGERGMAVEEDRALVWQVDAETGMHLPYKVVFIPFRDGRLSGKPVDFVTSL